MLARRFRAGLFHLSSLALGLFACSETPASTPAETELGIAEGCQPLLGGEACFLPYPSDFMRVADTTTATGFRLAVPPGSTIKAKDGKIADVHGLRKYDGFSTVATIVGALPGEELVATGLPNVNGDPAASATKESATLLLDTSTGKLVEHYTDLPSNRLDDGETKVRQSVAVRSFTKLAPRTRYVVALRKVLTASGEPAPPAPGFVKLRDKTAKEPALVAIRDRYEADVFAPLERLGVPRAELQLAWDFTTGSEEAAKSDMLEVRKLTLAWLAANTPKVTVSAVEPRTGPTWKIVRGTIEAPLFTETDESGAKLARDAKGAVMQKGTTQVAFSVHVPAALKTKCTKGRAIAYGHGFFGNQTEATSAPATEIGNRLEAVTFAIDWAGMSLPDRDWLARTISEDPARTTDFTERVHQAMGNWIVTTASVRKGLFDLPELSRPATGEGACEGDPEAGKPLFDSSRIHFVGISQGAILGGVLGTLDPDFSRVALNVTGSGFTHMMPRAAPFAPLFVIVHSVLGSSLSDQAFAASFQSALDRIDPLVYASNMLKEKLPGSPEDKRVLLQVGLGDSAVPPLGGFIHARALGISQTAPQAIPVFGVPEGQADTLSSAITLYDFGLGSNSAEPVPNPTNKVHDYLRKSDEAVRQLDAFLSVEGKVIHPCSGPCKLVLPP